ncbi:MAG: DUF4249 domain-containing protein [Saprospiraceae bacterium]|jgi:hypothetical protein|nr:DUF4249 domain-containing protein [Saprospiraceae bacterium]
MQRNIFSFFCSATIAMLLASCNGDKFSQVVEIDLPDHTPVLSVSAEFSNLDTLLTAFVYHTYATNQEPDSSNVANATIKLYEDGNLVREFAPRQFAIIQDSYVADGTGLFRSDGSTYRLEVSAPGYATVFAEQRLPQKIEIAAVTVKPESVPDPDGSKLDELVVEFDDPAGEENYYLLDAFEYFCYFDGAMDTFCYNNSVYLDSFDPLLEFSPNNGLIINDKTFDGKRVTLRATSYNSLLPSSPEERLIVQLVHLSREKYVYLRSLAQYENADGNPFAEPVTVQGNIEGGVGLFSLETMDTVQVRQ